MNTRNFFTSTVFVITFIFFVLGELLVFFLSNSERGFGTNIILGSLFVLLSSVVFYFVSRVILTSEHLDTSTEKEDLDSFDIHLREETEKRINAEMMNNAKSQFLSNMSQEVRIPMSGIIGMTELLSLTTLTKDQKEYLDIINYSSSTLLAIINDILDFSRIESGKLKLENIEFSIKELITKTSQILDFEARRKNLNLNIDISDKINYNIFGDPLRLNQLIINFTRNSIKYTDKGNILISLNEKSIDKNKAVLRLGIADTGMGFDNEKLHLFFGELGENGKVTLKKDFEYIGVGFGLPIICHLITLMNGDLYVETQQGKGTKITVDIPLTISTENLQEQKEQTEEIAIPTKKVDASEVNILVAEDNLVNQRLVKELLVRKKYSVTIVDNGLKIFDAMEHKKYDLILMDIQMPIMDGLEATSIIREIEKNTGNHIPVIGITAYAVEADKEKCLSVGMDDYMSKPFVKDEFYSMIEKYTNT